MKKLKFVALVVILFTSFSGYAVVSSVTGTITNAENEKFYFETYSEKGVQKLDSVQLSKSGKFMFKYDVKATDYYRIAKKGSNSPNDVIVLIIKPGEKITIKADGKKMNHSYTVKGSEFSLHLREFSTLVNNYITTRDSVSARFKRAIAKGNSEESEKLGKELGDAYNNFILGRDGFLAKYPKSPAVFAVFGHLNQQTDYDMMKKIENALAASAQGSLFHQQVAAATKRIEEMRKQEELKAIEAEKTRKAKENLAPGKEAYVFTMADSNGVQKSLAELRGKVVLLDFWASWCGPCRAENPNVVRNYAKYAEKGFTVLSVSLDYDRKKWLAAIKKDGLVWPNHVSELKGWQTSVLPYYGIASIPFTMLIDKDGKIIQANLRGPALEAKLREIFGF